MVISLILSLFFKINYVLCNMYILIGIFIFFINCCKLVYVCINLVLIVFIYCIIYFNFLEYI